MTHQTNFFINKDKHSLDDLKSAYLFSCKKDIELIKPGNVNLLSSHKDTKAQDYLDSAILSSKELFNQNYSLGKRILESVNVTRSKVNVNTNLGIILLCAPVIQSYIDFNNLDLREGIKKTLSTTSIKDTHDLCAAINISSPGGLGDSDMYDTASYPNASIKQIMDYSQEYDRISYQYSHNFSDIFDFIIPKLEFLNQRYESLDISLSLLFIEILAKIPDSHISRKFGDKIAKKTSNNAHD